MKKFLCLLLALSVLTSIPLTALATNQETLAETVSPEIEFDEPAIGAPEEIGYDPTSEEEAPIDSSEDVGYFIPTSENEESKLDDETLARRDRAEIEAKASRMTESDCVAIEATEPAAPGAMTTMSTQYNVTVTINFPSAATQDTEVLLYLYTPAVTDGNGLVTQDTAYQALWVDVAKGATSVSHIFTASAGKYFPGIYSYNNYCGFYAYKDLYFNSDGSYTTNPYTVTPITVTSDKIITVNMPQPERVISGTIQFSTAVTESFSLRVNGQNYYYSGEDNYFSNRLTVPAGATSVDFSFPVRPDSYRLYFSGNGNYGYYDVYGAISTSYNNRAYISVQEDSVINLVIDGDALLKEQEEGEGTVTYRHDVNYTVKLPETLTSGKHYMTLIFMNGELWDHQINWVPAGESEYTIAFTMTEGYSFSLGYVDATAFGNISWSDYYPTARYIGEDDSVTSIVSQAKVFTMETEDMDITLDDTDNYKLTGTLNLEAAPTDDTVYFPMVEFADGEIFGARVIVPSGTTSVDYTIYVPKTASGDFEHWVVMAYSGNSTHADYDTLVEGESYTLSGNMSLNPLTISDFSVSVTGTISLPEGMVAPAGGLAMYVYINQAYMGHYYMAEGKSSVTLDVRAVPSDYNYISVNLINAPENLCHELSDNPESLTDELDLVLTEAVTLSGRIYAPESAKDYGTAISIWSYGDSFYYENRLTVLPGETSEYYSFKVAKGASVYMQVNVTADGNGTVASSYLYLNQDTSGLTTSSSYTGDVTISENSTADFTLEEGNIITGTLSLPDGVPGGEYSYRVELYSVDDENWFYAEGSFNGTSTTWKAAVPKSYTGQWRAAAVLWYYGEDMSTVMTDTWLYYTTDGSTSNYNEVDYFYAPAEGIDFVFPKAWSITGTITIPDEFQNYYFGGIVYAIDENSTWYNGSFNSNSLTYQIKLPTDYTGTYKLAIRGRYYNNVVVPGLITSNLYLTADGSLSASSGDAATFTVDENGLVQDWTLPVGKSCAITINSPDGNYGYYEGQISLFDKESGDHLFGQSFWYEGTYTTVNLTLPAELAENELVLGVYVYYGENTVLYNWRFWTSTGWVNSTSEAEAFPFGDGKATITIPAAKSATLVLNAPDGFSGYYYLRATLVVDNSYGGWDSVETRWNSFEGNSGEFTFSLPDDSESDEYKVLIYMRSAPGCPTDTNYFYAGDNTWSTDYTNAVAVDFSSGSVELTLPKAKIISGSFFAADGSELVVPNSTGNFSVYSVAEGYWVSCSSSIKSDGTFSVTVDPSLTGDCYLYCRTYGGSDTNVASGTYYYKKDATEAVYTYDSSDPNYYINLDNGDVTDLELCVETGYVLTGNVVLDENVTVTHPSGEYAGWLCIELTIPGETSYTTSYPLYQGHYEFPYSFVVPKDTTEVTISSWLELYSSTTTNLYSGETEHGSVTVDGDGALPDITLVPAKDFVTATITTPLSGYYTEGYLKVFTESQTYMEYFCIYSNETRTSVSVGIPAVETSESYTVGYYLFSPERLIREQHIYISEDGSLTADTSQAGTFYFATDTEYAFTLLEQPPLIQGKIYLPDELDDDDFEIYLRDSLTYTTWITVNSETIQVDEDGRKYVSYTKYNSNYGSGDEFYMYYYLINYTGTLLYNNSNYYGRAYVGENGSFTFQGTNDCHYFAIPESGTATVDFTLLTNENCAANALLQSDHYPYNANGQSYTITYPGATGLSVTFDSRTDVELSINGTWYDWYYYSGSTRYFDVSDTNGTLTITAMNVGELSNYFGFAITAITPSYPDGETVPGVTAVYTSKGTDEATVMADLILGETVRVSVTGEANSSSILAAAVYDASGRMIDLIWENLTFDEYGNAVCPLHYENAEGVVTLKVMLLSTSMVPLAQAAELAAAE